MSQQIREATDSTFDVDYLLVPGRPLLVEFWAEWCAPCKLQQSVVAGIADERADTLTVARLDVDNNAGITERYNIKGIPTLIVFRDGREIERVVGVVQRDALVTMIERCSAPAQ